MISEMMAHVPCRYWIWGVGAFEDPLCSGAAIIDHPEALGHIEQMDPSFANQPDRWAIAATLTLNDILLLKARHPKTLHDAALRRLTADPSESVAR